MPDLTEIYLHKSPSVGPKSALTLIHLAIVLIVTWLLLAGGIVHTETRLHLTALIAPRSRRILLFAAATICFARTLIAMFIFVRRRMTWREIGAIAVWIGAIQLLFAFFGGRKAKEPGVWEVAGVFLYLLGSFLNTVSELQRHLWKNRPENAGRLYVGGLFRLARHINYFGDTVLFIGWALLTGCFWLLFVPGVMLLGFVFVNVPALDRYLAKRYGGEFEKYATHTRRLIPFVY